MIPLQLMLRNFLSYGATIQTIDFEPYHLICLTGKNGHGKSALLDAITWALWGQARKIGGIIRSDEHLMRLGQTHMMVTLDFLCNKNRYRVNRELVLYANKKAHTELSLGIYKEEAHNYLSLNEKTSRATQEKIIELLGLDYEGCVNSIFLRQGQSNEFSKRAPQERKEILASMLGLNQYEELRRRTLEKGRAIAREREQLIHLIEALNKEGSSQEELEEKLTYLKEQLKKNLEQETFFSQKIHVGEEKRQTLLIKQQELNTTLLQATRINQERMEKKRLFISEVLLWRATRRQKKELATFPDLTKELRINEAARTAYQAQEERSASIKELLVTITAEEHKTREHLVQTYAQALSEHEKTVHKERLTYEQINQKKNETEKKLAALTQQISSAAQQVTALNKALQEKELLLRKLQQHQNHKARLSHFLQRWHLRKEKNEQELSSCLLQEQLQEATLPSSNQRCPLCTQKISPHEHAKLQQKTMLRKKHVERQLKRLSDLCQKLHATQIAEEKKIGELLNQNTILDQLTIDYAVLQKRCSAYEQEKEQLLATHTLLLHEEETLRSRVSKAEAELDAWQTQKDTFFTTDTQLAFIRQKKETLLAELKTMSLNNTDLIALNNQHAYLVELQEKEQTIKEHLNEQPKRRAEIAALSKRLKELKKELKELDQARTTAPIIEQDLIATNRALEQIKLHLPVLSQQKEALLIEQGALEQQKNLQEQRAAAQKVYLQKKNRSEKQLEDYQLIASALSKNGIQALIIENAIPEIEAEANALLAQLTENQAHVIFESVRDLKGGGTKETLDIKISDALGIRPYELFSGGEAFRIDFAIRIAISKLLARRSGTSLQTLVIDEGFGSQDEEGLAMIMEALYKIQDDFEKIIVVSHLAEMKTEFPTNFFVQKDSSGSSITVLQQG